MPLDALPTWPVSTQERADSLHLKRASAINACSAAISSARDQIHQFLAKPSGSYDPTNLRAAICRVAALAADLPRGTTDLALRDELCLLVRQLLEHAIYDVPGLLTGADVPKAKGWPGIVAAMLLEVPWRLPSIPPLEQVPDWLWSDFARWVFQPPQVFRNIGDADLFAASTFKSMQDLSHWVTRNIGSRAVREALSSYLTHFSFLPLVATKMDLSRHAELHARILMAGYRNPQPSSRRAPPPFGDRMRIAFLATNPSLIPTFSRLLDPDRFEVSLYVLEGADLANGTCADPTKGTVLSLLKSGNRTRQFQELAPELTEQLAELQSAGLDAAVFSEEVVAAGGRLHRLASQRVAPLHVHIGATVPTGLPTADVFLVSSAEVASGPLQDRFRERLVIVPCATISVSERPSVVIGRSEARSALGLPDACFVMLTAARLTEITPEMRSHWVDLLREFPSTRLVIQILHSKELPAAAINNWAADWDEVLKQREVGLDRVMILSGEVETLVDLHKVVAAADLFLDAGAFAEPEVLCVPLDLSIPVVSVEGGVLRARRAAGLLRSLGLDRLIASDPQRVRAIVAALLDSEELAKAKESVRIAWENAPLCKDDLAAADAFGLAIERSQHEMRRCGIRAFLAGSPLTSAIDRDEGFGVMNPVFAEPSWGEAYFRAMQALASKPNDSSARQALARVYLGRGRVGRAVEYLLAAVQHSDSPTLWFELATALRQNGQRKEAIQALETILRMEPSQNDAWIMLLEMAEEIGAMDIARDALAAWKLCSPDEPRLQEWLQRVEPN